MRGAGILKWPFQGEPHSSCFFVVFRAASSICISFLYIKLGGLPGAGKVHLKCSNEKQSQLRQSAAKTSSHVHVEPSALVWQIIENILVDPRESFQRTVIACQAPETFLFSIFLWEGRELSFHRKACDVPFTMYTKFVPIFMQHRGILKNARGCVFMPFQRFLNALVWRIHSW